MTKEEPDEPDIRELLGKAFDIVRYAPIGALLDGPSLLPELAERGKVHVRNAELLGRLALKQAAAAAAPQVTDLLRMMGLLPPDRAAPAPEPPTAEQTPSRPNASGPDASTLAIPDYESLSASQVVNRLPSLSSDELDAVAAYESAHRGRKTILNKVAQLG